MASLFLAPIAAELNAQFGCVLTEQACGILKQLLLCYTKYGQIFAAIEEKDGLIHIYFCRSKLDNIHRGGITVPAAAAHDDYLLGSIGYSRQLVMTISSDDPIMMDRLYTALHTLHNLTS